MAEARMSKDLTSNQRQALECFRTARSRGVALSAQAREQGLNVRVIYDAVAALRRKGLLPTAGSGRSVEATDFVAVRVAPIPISTGGEAVCRLRVGVALIECRQWPPAAWLTSLAEVSGDAAPGRD
jgi:hypothetical protein